MKTTDSCVSGDLIPSTDRQVGSSETICSGGARHVLGTRGYSPQNVA